MQTSLSDTCVTLDQLRQTLNTECPICCNPFSSPTTTPCGHTFCRECLIRSLDYQHVCPCCRDPVQHCPPPTSLLVTFISQLFPQTHTLDPSVYDLENDNRVPLLIGNLTFPHTQCSIHIFEPRYRLMLRRIMASTRRRFAMCLARRRRTASESPFYEHGVMLELMHVQTLADGRSIVEAVGSHRFRVISSELLDGYHMAEIERLDDMDSEQEALLEQQAILKASAVRARLQRQPSKPLSMRVMPTSLPTVGQRTSWAQQAHPQSQIKKAPWLQMHVRGLAVARSKPLVVQKPIKEEEKRVVKQREVQSTEDMLNDVADFIERLMHHRQSNSTSWLHALSDAPALRGPQRDRIALTWWFVNMMPLTEEEKYSVLPIRNFRERLLIIMSWVDRFQDQWSLYLNQPYCI